MTHASKIEPHVVAREKKTPATSPKRQILPPSAETAQVVDLAVERAFRKGAQRAASTNVKDATTCGWGISPSEARRWLAFGEHLERYLRRGYVVLYLCIAAAHLDDASLLAVRRDVMRVLGKAQDRAGMQAPVWGEVRETASGSHFNIVFAMPKDCVDVAEIETTSSREIWRPSCPYLDGSLFASERFTKHDLPPLNGKSRKLLDYQMVQPGELWNILRYCLKETSPQAAHSLKGKVRRIRGSHKLTIGGDRVRLSNSVRGALERAGRIKPYRATNAKAPRSNKPTQGGEHKYDHKSELKIVEERACGASVVQVVTPDTFSAVVSGAEAGLAA